jgi:octaprenyl-diphosphate synthase
VQNSTTTPAATASAAQLIAADMREVDAVIRRRLASDVVLVNQIAEYIIGAGGKRLRPALVLYSAGALGYRGTHHHELAAVVEFIHTATLLHDDVVDESDLRRGNRTANALFGNAASVLVGDFLYSRAFQMMVKVGSMRVQEVLADATNVIAEGEVLQLLNCHNADVDVSQYLQVIRYKTAKLFEAAARLGAILVGAPPAVEEGLARYGMHLGTAFQIVDDVLDYEADPDALGKPVGSDLAEGKQTLPLLLAHAAAAPAERLRLEELLAAGDGAQLEIVALVRRLGGSRAALAEARRYGEAAREALSRLPADECRRALGATVDYVVEREH